MSCGAAFPWASMCRWRAAERRCSSARVPARSPQELPALTPNNLTSLHSPLLNCFKYREGINEPVSAPTFCHYNLFIYFSGDWEYSGLAICNPLKQPGDEMPWRRLDYFCPFPFVLFFFYRPGIYWHAYFCKAVLQCSLDTYFSYKNIAYQSVF